ncbi:FAD-binding protein [Amycolatopsis nigrescens]|uniref:FAD-binding protein n=1 Tax=Amycolatopsis nigrescens TaxID=381445 RepID=UPI00037DDEF2|nr:FAD-binding protein [Amycolatopsis nigrescens]
MGTWDLARLPGLDGELCTSEAELALASQDWGGLIRVRPAAVVRAGSVADISAVLGFAAAHGVPVAARGAGHSPFGQCQAEGGIVLDLTDLHAVHRITDREVTVAAGATWQQVLAATLPRHSTPPVLTDYLELTVGGTLVVGGIGGASHHHGTQTDTVTALQVVTGTGEVLSCSPEQHRDLFDAARSGLGQCGVITRATVRLLPAERRARRWKLYYHSLHEYLADQRTVVRDGRFDYLEGQLIPDPETGTWRYLLEAVSYYSPPAAPDERSLLGGLSYDPAAIEAEDVAYLEFLDRMADGEAALRAEGSWFHPHPWLNVFLPDHAVRTFVTGSLAEIGPAELGGSGLVMLYPVRAERLRTPLLRVPPGELVWLYAVLRTGRPFDPVGNARLIELNTALHRRAAAVGGLAYPANAVPMTGADWRAHFGAEWDRLSDAKRRYDPRGILAPGQRVF